MELPFVPKGAVEAENGERSPSREPYLSTDSERYRSSALNLKGVGNEKTSMR